MELPILESKKGTPDGDINKKSLSIITSTMRDVCGRVHHQDVILGKMLFKILHCENNMSSKCEN